MNEDDLSLEEGLIYTNQSFHNLNLFITEFSQLFFNHRKNIICAAYKNGCIFENFQNNNYKTIS